MMINGFSLTVQRLHDGKYEGTYLHKRERWTVSAVAGTAEGALEAVRQKFLSRGKVLRACRRFPSVCVGRQHL